MKRVFSAVCAAVLLFLCCSCGAQPSAEITYPLTVNSTPVDSEVFTYFLHEAVSELPQQTKDEQIYYAVQLCIQYVAVNSTFTQEGLRLSSAELSEMSTDANTRWNLFGGFYEAIGVSKQTFVKICRSGEYTEKLRQAYFGEGGTEEIAESTLRDYLAARYVAFREVRVPKKTTDKNGNEKDRTAAQEKSLREKLNAGLTAINRNGTGIESVYATFLADGKGDREEYAEVITDGTDHEYPAEFVNAVREMDMNTAAILDFSDSYYLVYREEVAGDEDIFEEYRDDCLEALTGGDLQKKIEEIGRAYSSVKDTAAVEQCWKNYTNAKAQYDQ